MVGNRLYGKQEVQGSIPNLDRNFSFKCKLISSIESINHNIKLLLNILNINMASWDVNIYSKHMG